MKENTVYYKREKYLAKEFFTWNYLFFLLMLILSALDLISVVSGVILLIGGFAGVNIWIINDYLKEGVDTNKKV